MSYFTDFERDGYVVIPEVLSSAHCADLLRETIACFHSSTPTVIKEPSFRRHTPLPLSQAVSDALTLSIEHAHPVLSPFLKKTQELVELSSITVFPNAAEQPLHRDEANEGHYLASVFLNLAKTSEEVGALHLVPGSHDLHEGGSGAPIAIEVPQGSAVIMNSKLLHYGGANQSADRIRSVVYFSVGEPNLYGPPYSILEEVRAQHIQLDELLPRFGQTRTMITPESRPQLTRDCELFLPLSGDTEELVLARNGVVVRRRIVQEEEEFLLDAMQRIDCHPQELTVSDLASLCEVDIAVLQPVLAELARDGWICW
tara:strand:- start:9941 stop:10882 length:942 start_codon:yes stop_codon:yes gene_type:complete